MDESAPPPARRQGLLLLGVVFVLGLVCGAALLFLGHRMIMRGGFRGVGPWGGRDRMGLERLSGELSLD